MHAHSLRAARAARTAPPSVGAALRMPRLAVAHARHRRSPRSPPAATGGGDIGGGGNGGGITWDRPVGAWDGDDQEEEADGAAATPLSSSHPAHPSLLRALGTALGTGARVLAATCASAATVWGDCVFPRASDVARLTVGVLAAAGGLVVAVFTADAAAAAWYGRGAPALGRAVERMPWVGPKLKTRTERLDAEAAAARVARLTQASAAAAADSSAAVVGPPAEEAKKKKKKKSPASKLNQGLRPVFVGGVTLPDAVPVVERRRRRSGGLHQPRWAVFEALG